MEDIGARLRAELDKLEGPIATAHQAILDLHGNDRGSCSTCYSVPQRELVWDGVTETWQLRTGPVKYPCGTVRAVAGAYGVEA